MSMTEQFIRRLESMGSADRSSLRRLTRQSLADTTQSFDLFTGLWWPLRQKSPVAPRRETSWLVARLCGEFPLRHVRSDDTQLATILGRLEPRDKHAGRRFRARFDALLQSPLAALEPLLRWALAVITEAVGKRRCCGLDWASLLDDLSIWDRGEEHRRERDVRDIWAEEYLKAVGQSTEEVSHETD